jgi:hypothetical protein
VRAAARFGNSAAGFAAAFAFDFDFADEALDSEAAGFVVVRRDFGDGPGMVLFFLENRGIERDRAPRR